LKKKNALKLAELEKYLAGKVEFNDLMYEMILLFLGVEFMMNKCFYVKIYT